MTSAARSMSVVHRVAEWLPPTQPWIASQIAHLPPHVRSVVLADEATAGAPATPPLHTPTPATGLAARVSKRWPRFAQRRDARWLARRLRRLAPDLVHSHFGDVAWRSHRDVQRAQACHAVSFYGFDASRLPVIDARWKHRYGELFDAVDLVLCEGPFLADTVHRLGCPRDRLQVHAIGVELDRLPFRPRELEANRPLRILVAAGFREKKGIPDAIRAVALAAQDVPMQLTIVGDARPTGRSQDERRRILEALDESQLGDRVVLTGFVRHTELLALALRHHVFLAPSRTATDGDSEGGAPVALIEMAATGMPIVSTRHCDIPYVLDDGRAGWLANEGDVAGIAAHLRWLAQHPDDWGPRLARARSRIETVFDAKLQGQRLGAAYARVMADAPGAHAADAGIIRGGAHD